jgi:uncharacterized Fe-S cluster-containing MiaB family protein
VRDLRGVLAGLPFNLKPVSANLCSLTEDYPITGTNRDQWIVAKRPARNALDLWRPYAFLVEEERAESGEVVPVATIFLTNRECPWRCLMCDLWKNTLTETVPLGAIPAQIDYALGQLETACDCPHNVEDSSRSSRTAQGNYRPRPSSSSSVVLRRFEDEKEDEGRGRLTRQIKLYNSGSFFDPRAIPMEDYAAIAERVRPFERVIVECHPALVGESALRFRDMIDGRLEVAMGLETAHPEVLEKLNKRMTLEQFARAAEFLRQNDIALRVFILAKPPFLDEMEALHWAKRSLDFAFECGATVASLIPTRPGNGALEALAKRGEFSPPKLVTLEKAASYGIGLKRGRIFADLWDLEKFSTCVSCFASRLDRLREMNFSQAIPAPTSCNICGEIF